MLKSTPTAQKMMVPARTTLGAYSSTPLVSVTGPSGLSQLYVPLIRPATLIMPHPLVVYVVVEIIIQKSIEVYEAVRCSTTKPSPASQNPQWWGACCRHSPAAQSSGTRCAVSTP